MIAWKVIDKYGVTFHVDISYKSNSKWLELDGDNKLVVTVKIQATDKWVGTASRFTTTKDLLSGSAVPNSINLDYFQHPLVDELIEDILLEWKLNKLRL